MVRRLGHHGQRSDDSSAVVLTNYDYNHINDHDIHVNDVIYSASKHHDHGSDDDDACGSSDNDHHDCSHWYGHLRDNDHHD